MSASVFEKFAGCRQGMISFSIWQTIGDSLAARAGEEDGVPERMNQDVVLDTHRLLETIASANRCCAP
ncbi:MAG TPA: hypothetical protein VFN25_02380 [Dokdonella sp.]|uniref:hypothetical protein n=1 Tax=Dokdonella sp. TaxID=2291710 RepID=UPI002D7EFDC8|nr:hypothetical protein [Dokdonella sp.]HET9031731.1 hypothetical protein [Dokdonella sp.]